MVGVQNQTVASRVEIVQTSDLLPTLLRVAETTMARFSAEDVFALAQGLLDSEVVQVRMLAAVLLGLVADQTEAAKTMLREVVATDEAAGVREALGVAFAQYCDRVGYAYVQSDIADWLADPCPAVRLAVVEGLRVWTDRPYFDLWPEEAVDYLQWVVNDLDREVAASACAALEEVFADYPALRQCA